MLQDLDTIKAGWFYTWDSALPEIAVDGWFLGDEVSLVSTSGDPRVVLGSPSSEAWIAQTAQVEAGRPYDLFVHASGPASARGGLTIKFMDDAGLLLGERWTPLSGATGAGVLPDIVAPPGAVSATVIGWRSAGHGLALDDIMLVGNGTNVLQNGGFAASGRFSAMPREFVPMIWGRDDATVEQLTEAAEAWVLLGFNEPDIEGQANMTVGEAIGLWPKLAETGARLGSPATSTSETLGGDSWLSRFMAEADAKNLRVDFMAVHYYSSNPDVSAFRQFLEQVYVTYDRSVWVTEWGLVDWSDPNRFTFEETAAFFREGVLMMDELDFVERHAWFATYDSPGWSFKTNLFYDAGDLTPVGEVFAALAANPEFVECPYVDRLSKDAAATR